MLIKSRIFFSCKNKSIFCEFVFFRTTSFCDLIAQPTKQEVKELARAFETKVEDVLKVVSRNVSVEKVSEYRIVKR